MAFLPLLFGNNRRQQHTRRIIPVDRFNPLEAYDEDKFFKRYRFSKASFTYICDYFRDDLSRVTFRSSALTVEIMMCIALRFYATGSFLEVIGDTLNVGKATVSRVVTEVTNAIVRHMGKFIAMPDNENVIRRTMLIYSLV